MLERFRKHAIIVIGILVVMIVCISILTVTCNASTEDSREKSELYYDYPINYAGTEKVDGYTDEFGDTSYSQVTVTLSPNDSSINAVYHVGYPYGDNVYTQFNIKTGEVRYYSQYNSPEEDKEWTKAPKDGGDYAKYMDILQTLRTNIELVANGSNNEGLKNDTLKYIDSVIASLKK